MDRLFRGIGNRIRGEQAAEAGADRDDSSDEGAGPAPKDDGEGAGVSSSAADQDTPPTVADGDEKGGDPDTARRVADDAEESFVREGTTGSTAAADDGDDPQEVHPDNSDPEPDPDYPPSDVYFSEEPHNENAGTQPDDEDSPDAAADDTGSDEYTLVFTDGDGTLTFTNDGGATANDDGMTFTISDGGDDGLIVIGNSGGESPEPEPEPEPEYYPEPEPEPEPEPQPDEDNVPVGSETDAGGVVVVDDVSPPVEADRPEVFRPDIGSGSAGSISAAEALRQGLISPDDLRAQTTLEGRVNLSDFMASSDDDDDDDVMRVPRDEFIEIPRIENMPEPGTGPPNPQPREAEGLQVSSVEGRLIRDGSENLGSSLPPAAGGATYSALNAADEDDAEGDASEPEPNLPPGDYIIGMYDEDGNLIISHSSSEGYWLFPGGPDGEPEWHGEGDPTFDQPNPNSWPVPEVYEGPADNDSPTESEVEFSEDDNTDAPSDNEPEAPPAYEPPPMYTIGDPVSSGGQPSGISPADLRVSGTIDLNQYVNTDLIAERLARSSEDQMLADDEIERPNIKPERAPGEGPPQVGSLDVIERTAPLTSASGGNVQEGPVEEEDIPQFRSPNLDLEFAPVIDVPQAASVNPVDSMTMAGDSEAGEPSKVLDRSAMAGDSEAGEPSKTTEPIEARPDAAPELVKVAEVVNLDAPIDFQTTQMTGQPPAVAQVETAIPAAIEAQPAIANVELSVPVEPLVASDAIAEVLPPDAGSDDDNDPDEGM